MGYGGWRIKKKRPDPRPKQGEPWVGCRIQAGGRDSTSLNEPHRERTHQGSQVKGPAAESKSNCSFRDDQIQEGVGAGRHRGG